MIEATGFLNRAAYGIVFSRDTALGQGVKQGQPPTVGQANNATFRGKNTLKKPSF